jgi:hypothetical protein
VKVTLVKLQRLIARSDKPVDVSRIVRKLFDIEAFAFGFSSSSKILRINSKAIRGELIARTIASRTSAESGLLKIRHFVSISPHC